MSGHELGEKIDCRVLSVGPKRCLVECGGRDMSLSQKDLTYIAAPDLRERYHPGQTLDCVLKEYNRQTGQMWVSVKETMASHFFGAIKRHPIGSRRQAIISVALCVVIFLSIVICPVGAVEPGINKVKFEVQNYMIPSYIYIYNTRRSDTNVPIIQAESELV